jgi:hypothetical protein
VRLGLCHRLRHELIPLHLRERDGSVRIGDGWLHERSAVRECHSRSVLVWLYARVAHGCRGFVVEVGHQHRRRLEINHAIAAGLDLLKGRRIDGNGRLGRAGHGAGLGTCSTLHVAVEGDASVFGVYRSVMAKQEIASHEGTSTLHALERALLGVYDELSALFDGITMLCRLDVRAKICPARDPGEKEGKLGRNNKLTGSLMSAAMLAPRKSPVAELALILLLGQR